MSTETTSENTAYTQKAKKPDPRRSKAIVLLIFAGFAIGLIAIAIHAFANRPNPAIEEIKAQTGILNTKIVQLEIKNKDLEKKIEEQTKKIIEQDQAILAIGNALRKNQPGN
jgi:predicted PurR-regulated permease PerM